MNIHDTILNIYIYYNIFGIPVQARALAKQQKQSDHEEDGQARPFNFVLTGPVLMHVGADRLRHFLASNSLRPLRTFQCRSDLLVIYRSKTR